MGEDTAKCPGAAGCSDCMSIRRATLNAKGKYNKSIGGVTFQEIIEFRVSPWHHFATENLQMGKRVRERERENAICGM